MSRLIECVPNFSEGRRQEVVDQICARIRSVPGVQLLDVEMDPSHNRAVVTMVGAPEAVAEAAFRAVQEAAQHIDMRRHKGAHPRIGATDVVPFVPVRGVTMAECVETARAVGARIGAELGIPVYLYEEAAARPERKNLADVRRGEYEGLAQEIAANPERAPDFGPAVLGPAGATAVGARAFLVAYNVYLGTADLEVANQIARAVRHLSGGLRYVKALGVAVDRPGQVQVSMNLTDYRRTPIHRVMALIRDIAAHHGVAVLESEIVGLTPAEALLDVARYELCLHHMTADQVLENRLQGGAEAAGLGAALPRDLLAQVSAGTAAPGGGTVSAVSGSLAAALTRMVANLTIGKKGYGAVEEEMRAAEAAVGRLQEELLDLAVRDSASFEAIMAAYRLPKSDDAERAARREAVQAATREAARVPLTTVERTVKVLEFLARIAAAGNVNALTDAYVAIGMAEAAVQGAAANVRVNVASLDDTALGAQFQAQIAALETQAGDLAAAIRGTIAARQGG